MKTTSIFITLTFLLLIGANIMGQEISKLELNKIEPFETMKGSTADIVQVLPGEKVIEKTTLYNKTTVFTTLFCTDKNGKRTKIYEGGRVDYFSHSQTGERICFSDGGNFIIIDIPTLQEFRFQTVDAIYMSAFPNISPDGDEITFLKSERSEKEGVTINNDLIIVRNIITKEERIIGNGCWPRWSPNSSQIVFSRVEGSIGNWTSYLWVVNTNGTGLRKLKSSVYLSGAEVEWSPDGNYVMDPDRQGNLRIVDVIKDEAVVVPPTRFGKPPGNARKEYWHTSWSPDGKSILAEVYTFNYKDETLDRELFLISVDGTKIEKLIIPGLNNDKFPIWLNSNELLFQNTHLGNVWNKTIVRSAE